MSFQGTDIAYAAGLLDGEGCVAVYEYATKRGYQQVRFDVQISNTDSRPLLWLQATFGGRISRRGGVRRGVRRECYYWHLMNAKAAEFLKLVRPFCKIKGEQIDAAIEFRTTYINRHGDYVTPEARTKRSALIAEIAALKRRAFTADGRVVH